MLAALAAATVLHFAGQTDHSDVIPLDTSHTSVSIDIQHHLSATVAFTTVGTGTWGAHSVQRGSWAMTLPSGVVVDGRRAEATWAATGVLGASGLVPADMHTTGGGTISPVPAFVTVRTTGRTVGGSYTIGIGKVQLVFGMTYQFTAIIDYP